MAYERVRSGYMLVDAQGNRQDLTVPASTTSTVTTSIILDVQDFDSISVQSIIVSSNAGANGQVNFLFVGSLDSKDPGDFDTVIFKSVGATMSGTTPVRKIEHLLDLKNVKFLKIASLQNQDAVQPTTANLFYRAARFMDGGG